MEPSCGQCVNYAEKSKLCRVDQKYRTKVNGCYLKFVQRAKNGNPVND